MPYDFLKHKIVCISIGDSLKKYPNVKVYIGPIYRRPHGIKGWPYRICEEFGFDKSRWFSEWKDNIMDCDTIIIGDCSRGGDTFRYIRRVNPHARVIYYYLNSVLDKGYDYPPKLKKYGIELYTFDPKNAQDFQIKYKPFYYDRMLMKEKTEQDFQQDIFFVGADKGRLSHLMKLKDSLERMGLSCSFLIKRSKHKFYMGRAAQETMLHDISYESVCKGIQKSKAILDYVRLGQTGMTLRPYEAIHFNKKLITNNPWIEKEDFYHPQNIFILGKDNICELPHFLDLPSIPVPDEERNKYTPEAWLNGFFL